jgi:hypothetical protein
VKLASPLLVRRFGVEYREAFDVEAIATVGSAVLRSMGAMVRRSGCWPE